MNNSFSCLSSSKQPASAPQSRLAVLFVRKELASLQDAAKSIFNDSGDFCRLGAASGSHQVSVGDVLVFTTMSSGVGRCAHDQMVLSSIPMVGVSASDP